MIGTLAFGEFLLAFVDDLPQFPRGLERRDEMLAERHRFAGAGIARHARQTLLGPERAEATNFDMIAVGKRVRHGLKKTIDEDLRFKLCDSGCGRDAVDDVGFSHRGGN